LAARVSEPLVVRSLATTVVAVRGADGEDCRTKSPSGSPRPASAV